MAEAASSVDGLTLPCVLTTAQERGFLLIPILKMGNKFRAVIQKESTPAWGPELWVLSLGPPILPLNGPNQHEHGSPVPFQPTGSPV